MLRLLQQEYLLPNSWMYRQGDPPEGILIMVEGEAIVLHESSGYVFETLRRYSRAYRVQGFRI